MSNQDRLVITASVHDNIIKRVKATKSRMNRLKAGVISLREKGDAHKLLAMSGERLEAAIKSVEKDAEKRGLRAKPQMRKLIAGLASAYNTVDSALDALGMEELTQKDLTEAADQVNAVMTEFATLWEANTINESKVGEAQKDAADIFIEKAITAGSPLKKIKTKKETGPDKEDLHTYEQTPGRDWYPQVQHIIEKQGVHKDKLPNAKINTDPFVLLHLPVVPLGDSIPSADAWKEAGFRIAGSVGSYTIIDQQVMVAVNTKMADRKGVTRYAGEIVKIISKRKGERYVFMGGEGGVMSAGKMDVKGRSPGFVFFWIVPESKLKRLSRIADRSGASVAVEDWGLAV